MLKSTGKRKMQAPADFNQDTAVLLVDISDMKASHIHDVMEIDAQSAPRPWARTLWDQELANEEARSYRIAKSDKTLAGFCGVMYLPDEAHITTIAVEKTLQRRSIGTQLVLDAAHRAIDHGSTSFSLEVRTLNSPAQHLYRQFGMAPAGIRKNYYPDSREDAIVMFVSDIDKPEFADRLQVIEERITGSGRKWES
jgi:ribosomal-protein-alanine N-acetyltransferase